MCGFTASDNKHLSTYVIKTDSMGNSGCSTNQATAILTTLTPSFQANPLTLTSSVGILLNNISSANNDTLISSQVNNCLSSCSPTSVNEVVTTKCRKQKRQT